MNDYDPHNDLRQVGLLDDNAAPDWVLEQTDRDRGDCWWWTGYRLRRPSGDRAIAARHGRISTAGRLLWAEMRGPLPRQLLVRHLCGQGLCLRPSHLLLGTALDRAHSSRRRTTL